MSAYSILYCISTADLPLDVVRDFVEGDEVMGLKMPIVEKELAFNAEG